MVNYSLWIPITTQDWLPQDPLIPSLIVRNVLLTWQHAIRQELLSYITNFHTSLIPFCKFLVTRWLNLPSTMSNNQAQGHWLPWKSLGVNMPQVFPIMNNLSRRSVSSPYCHPSDSPTRENWQEVNLQKNNPHVQTCTST
jgi:hypothetical protein